MIRPGAASPGPHDPDALTRPIDPAARAVLLDDTPDIWKPNLNALANLASAKILDRGRFDALTEGNKYVVVARVRHVLAELSNRYVRHVGTDGPDAAELRSSGVIEEEDGLLVGRPPVFYLRDEDLWRRLSDLASDPGVKKGIVDPANREFHRFLDQTQDDGDLVRGEYLEALLRHAPGYLEDPVVGGNRQPELDLEHLDRDLVHAFLCAYAATFHA